MNLPASFILSSLVLCGSCFARNAWTALEPDARSSLVLRGGAETPEGRITAVSLDGVTIAMAGDTPRSITLGWDRVASVRGVDALGEVAVNASRDAAPIADAAWRARTRLARGDAPGAEPLFEALFTRYEGRSGATAAVVSSGLLRCRLTRQAQAAAVRPWLALVASGEPEVVFDTPALVADGIVVPPLTDSATGLAPGLPPIWIAGPSLQTVISQGPAAPQSAEGSPGATRAGVLGALYIASARADMGEPVTLPARATGDDGLALVWDVVAATAGTAEQRAQARERLLARITDEATPQWAEAWSRVALGRSMLRDGTGEDALRGMVHLLHVPSRLDHASAYLAGIALLEVARAHERNGQTDAATRIWRELESKYPDHPALAEQGMKQLGSQAGAPGVSGGGP